MHRHELRLGLVDELIRSPLLQDSGCVATLTSVISDEFGSLNEIGWYGSS